MRMPEVQRQPIEEEEEETIQPKEASTKFPPTRLDIETNIQSSRTGGTTLLKSTRTFFEPRFGHDFSKVKLHTNTQAAELALTEITPLMQRQENLGEEEDEELIQAKTTGGVTPEVTHAISSGIQSLQGGGQPLSGTVRSFFEPRFGEDFSNVRVHNDTRAARVARLVNSRAFTLGHNVVFGAGEYSPDALAGRKLLAHELTHVVQQKRSTQLSIQRNGYRKDAFGKECPDTVVIGSIKPLTKFNKALFNQGIRTWLGINSYMKVGPKKKYESCISEVLKVEENTCGNKGKLANYKPCGPKKYCLPVGGTKKIPTNPNIFLDMHRTRRKFSLLEGSGKKTCKVTCLQRYGCGGKEIGRFHVTRTFKAATFQDGKKRVSVTLGSIKKVIAKRKKK